MASTDEPQTRNSAVNHLDLIEHALQLHRKAKEFQRAVQSHQWPFWEGLPESFDQVFTHVTEFCNTLALHEFYRIAEATGIRLDVARPTDQTNTITAASQPLAVSQDYAVRSPHEPHPRSPNASDRAVGGGGMRENTNQKQAKRGDLQGEEEGGQSRVDISARTKSRDPHVSRVHGGQDHDHVLHSRLTRLLSLLPDESIEMYVPVIRVRPSDDVRSMAEGDSIHVLEAWFSLEMDALFRKPHFSGLHFDTIAVSQLASGDVDLYSSPRQRKILLRRQDLWLNDVFGRTARIIDNTHQVLIHSVPEELCPLDSPEEKTSVLNELYESYQIESFSECQFTLLERDLTAIDNLDRCGKGPLAQNKAVKLTCASRRAAQHFRNHGIRFRKVTYVCSILDDGGLADICSTCWPLVHQPGKCYPSPVVCGNCSGLGHGRPDCPDPQRCIYCRRLGTSDRHRCDKMIQAEVPAGERFGPSRKRERQSSPPAAATVVHKRPRLLDRSLPALPETPTVAEELARPGSKSAQAVLEGRMAVSARPRESSAPKTQSEAEISQRGIHEDDRIELCISARGRGHEL